jgi:hypothetical protein
VRDVCMKRVSVPLFPRRPGPGVVPILGHCFLDTLVLPPHRAHLPFTKEERPSCVQPLFFCGDWGPRGGFSFFPQAGGDP